MANSSTNRAKWIKNLIAYMNKYGFQGVDIDWEWPVDSGRGGTPADTVNFVALMKETRAAFGTDYGLSVALVTDIDALKHIDVKGMEQYVDFFNFMSYDYHVPVVCMCIEPYFAWVISNSSNRIRLHPPTQLSQTLT